MACNIVCKQKSEGGVNLKDTISWNYSLIANFCGIFMPRKTVSGYVGFVPTMLKGATCKALRNGVHRPGIAMCDQVLRLIGQEVQ